MERNPLIVIPSQVNEKGVRRKQVLDADGKPMVIQTWKRAVEAGIGNVIVDCTDDETSEVVGQEGAYVYRSEPDEDDRASNYRTESGAERVAAVVNRFDRLYNHDVIINLHDGLPDVDPVLIRALLYPMANLDVDIATLVTPLAAGEETDPEAVKVRVEWIPRARVNFLTDSRIGRALDFSRVAADVGDAPYYRLLPIYAYRRASLDRFVRADPTARELEERLEPMRAIENGMRIDVVTIDEAPPGIEDDGDLADVRKQMREAR